MQRRAKLQLVALLVATTAPQSNALAQSAPQDQAASRAHFEQGIALMAAKDYARACPRLEEAVRLQPGRPGPKVALADCYEASSRLASAWTMQLEVAHAFELVAQADGPDRAEATARAAAARAKGADLKARLSMLTIAVPPEVAAVPGLEIRRDGVVVGKPALGAPVPVDGGTHRVAASAPGYVGWSGVVEAPVDRGVVTIAVPTTLGKAPAEPGGDSKGQGELVPAAPGLGGQRWAALAIGGVGVAGVVVGSVFGLTASSTWKDAKSHCGNGSECTAEGLTLRDTASTQGNVSTGAFIVGGAGLATAIVLWLTAPSPKAGGATVAQPRLAPRIESRGAGFELTGGF